MESLIHRQEGNVGSSPDSVRAGSPRNEAFAA